MLQVKLIDKMNITEIQSTLGNVDIYIIDQILKNRYTQNDTILDAGCAEGRNLKWFYANNFNIYGIDTDKGRLENAQLQYPKCASNFQTGNLDNLPYQEALFNHIICSAVLHFAKDEAHFLTMFSELFRVLKPNGTLFIRVASTIGLDGNTPYLQEGITGRLGSYYITRATINKLLNSYNIQLLDPIKTTNVEDLRAMTTLVFQKV